MKLFMTTMATVTAAATTIIACLMLFPADPNAGYGTGALWLPHNPNAECGRIKGPAPSCAIGFATVLGWVEGGVARCKAATRDEIADFGLKAEIVIADTQSFWSDDTKAADAALLAAITAGGDHQQTNDSACRETVGAFNYWSRWLGLPEVPDNVGSNE